MSNATVCAGLPGGKAIPISTDKTLCQVTPPDSAAGSNAATKCAATKASGATMTYAGSSYYYDTVSCTDFSVSECSAANATMPVLKCYVEEWGSCKTREECLNAGECDVHIWDGHEIHDIVRRVDKGMCLFPRPYIAEDIPEEHHHWTAHAMDPTTETDTHTTTLHAWMIDIRTHCLSHKSQQGLHELKIQAMLGSWGGCPRPQGGDGVLVTGMQEWSSGRGPRDGRVEFKMSEGGQFL